MKKEFKPLSLDKKTIAKLDREQLSEIRGGLGNAGITPGTSCQEKKSCRGGTTCAGGHSCSGGSDEEGLEQSLQW